MRILLIEDNIYKAIDIERALESCGVNNIVRVGFQEEALELIEADQSYDLIVTDMRYPLHRGGDEDLEASFKLIAYLKNRELSIPVVICSTSNYESVTDAFGTVWYSELNDIKRDFKRIIGKINKKGMITRGYLQLHRLCEKICINLR